MIEIIEVENKQVQQGKWRSLPKNVRQIGECTDRGKIYIEDYVVTYLNKMARPEQAYARGAILFGDICDTEEGKAVFISGAVEAGNLELDMDEVVFDEMIWHELREKGERYFPGQEVMGWFLSRMGFSVEMNQKIINTHRRNFKGEDKVLYMIDSLEKEDAMYLCENQQLIRQKGYYIYYEKNSAMRDYMLESEGQEQRISEEQRGKTEIRRDRKIVNSYRRMTRYKKDSKKQDLRMKAIRGACVALIFVMGTYIAVKLGNRFVNMGMDDYAIATFQAVKNVFMPDTVPTAEEDILKGDEMDPLQGKSSDEESKTAESSRTEEEDNGNTSDIVSETGAYLKPLYYTVQRGDTLAAISRKMYSTDKYTSQIAKANNLSNADEIYEGQKILIPSIE